MDMAVTVIKQHLIDPEICIRCNTCEAICPVGAITHDSLNYVVKADICNLPFENDQYDLILCNHVLEHIPDDTKAMQELNMTGGRFEVALNACEPAAYGLEQVEFMVAGHAGVAPRPLA